MRSPGTSFPPLMPTSTPLSTTSTWQGGNYYQTEGSHQCTWWKSCRLPNFSIWCRWINVRFTINYLGQSFSSNWTPKKFDTESCSASQCSNFRIAFAKKFSTFKLHNDRDTDWQWRKKDRKLKPRSPLSHCFFQKKLKQFWKQKIVNLICSPKISYH